MSDGTHYFVKEILSNDVRLASGRRIPWESVGDDTGVLATNNQQLAAELQLASRKGTGGIREVDQAAYEDTKKKSVVEQLRKQSQLRANNMLPRPRISSADPAAAANAKKPAVQVSPAGEPLRVPTTIPAPKPAKKRRSVISESTPASGPVSVANVL